MRDSLFASRPESAQNRCSAAISDRCSLNLLKMINLTTIAVLLLEHNDLVCVAANAGKMPGDGSRLATRRQFPFLVDLEVYSTVLPLP